MISYIEKLNIADILNIFLRNNMILRNNKQNYINLSEKRRTSVSSNVVLDVSKMVMCIAVVVSLYLIKSDYSTFLTKEVLIIRSCFVVLPPGFCYFVLR